MFLSKLSTNSGIPITLEFQNITLLPGREWFICKVLGNEGDVLDPEKLELYSSVLDVTKLILEKKERVLDVFIVLPSRLLHFKYPLQVKRLEDLLAIPFEGDFGRCAYKYITEDCHEYITHNFSRNYDPEKINKLKKYPLIHYDSTRKVYIAAEYPNLKSVNQDGLVRY